MIDTLKYISMTKLGQKLTNMGAEQERLRITKNLVGLLAPELVCEFTGLPLEIVLQLRKKQFEQNSNS